MEEAQRAMHRRRVEEDMGRLREQCAQFQRSLTRAQTNMGDIVWADNGSGACSLAGDRLTSLPDHHGNTVVDDHFVRPINGDALLYDTPVRNIFAEGRRVEDVVDQLRMSTTCLTSHHQKQGTSLSVDKPPSPRRCTSPYRRPMTDAPPSPSSHVVDMIKIRNERRLQELRDKMKVVAGRSSAVAVDPPSPSISKSPPVNPSTTADEATTKPRRNPYPSDELRLFMKQQRIVRELKREEELEKGRHRPPLRHRPYSSGELAVFMARQAEGRLKETKENTREERRVRHRAFTKEELGEFMGRQRREKSDKVNNVVEEKRERERRIKTGLRRLQSTADTRARRTIDVARNMPYQRKSTYGAFYGKFRSSKSKEMENKPLLNLHRSTFEFTANHVSPQRSTAAQYVLDGKRARPMTMMAAEAAAMKHLRSPVVRRAVQQKHKYSIVKSRSDADFAVKHAAPFVPQLRSIMKTSKRGKSWSGGLEINEAVEQEESSSPTKLNAPDPPIVSTYSPMADLRDYLQERIVDDQEAVPEDDEFNISYGSLSSLPPEEPTNSRVVLHAGVNAVPTALHAAVGAVPIPTAFHAIPPLRGVEANNEELRDHIITGLHQLDTVNESLRHLQNLEHAMSESRSTDTQYDDSAHDLRPPSATDDLLRQLVELNKEQVQNTKARNAEYTYPGDAHVAEVVATATAAAIKATRRSDPTRSTSSAAESSESKISISASISSNDGKSEEQPPRTSTPINSSSSSREPPPRAAPSDDVSTISSEVHSSLSSLPSSADGSTAQQCVREHVQALKSFYRAKVAMMKRERGDTIEKASRRELKAQLQGVLDEMEGRKADVRRQLIHNNHTDQFVTGVRNMTHKLVVETEAMLRGGEGSPSIDAAVDGQIEIVKTDGFLHLSADTNVTSPAGHVLLQFVEGEDGTSADSDAASVLIEEFPTSPTSKDSVSSVIESVPVSATKSSSSPSSEDSDSGTHVGEGEKDTSSTPSSTSSAHTITEENVIDKKLDNEVASAGEVRSELIEARKTSTTVTRRQSWPMRRDVHGEEGRDEGEHCLSENQELACRIEDLRTRLANRRSTASKLRTEYKRHAEEHTLYREKSLKRQIDLYDGYITETENQISNLEKSFSEGQMERSATPILHDVSQSSSKNSLARRHSLTAAFPSIMQLQLANQSPRSRHRSGGSSSKERSSSALDTSEDEVSSIDQDEGEGRGSSGQGLEVATDDLVESIIQEQIDEVIADVHGIRANAKPRVDSAVLQRAQYERILAIASGVAAGESSPRRHDGKTVTADELELRYLHSTPDNDGGGDLSTSGSSSVLSLSAPAKAARSFNQSASAYISHVPDRYDGVMGVLRLCMASIANEGDAPDWLADVTQYPPLPDGLLDDMKRNGNMTPVGETSYMSFMTLLYHHCIEVCRRLTGVHDAHLRPIAHKLLPPLQRAMPPFHEVLYEVEMDMLRAHPTVAHDARIVVPNEGGVCDRVRHVSRYKGATTSASNCRAARMSQMCRVYRRAPLLRDVGEAREGVEEEVVDDMYNQLQQEIISDVVKQVYLP